MYITVADFIKKHQKTFHKMQKEILKHQRIVVFRHLKPDYDAFGSQMGLVTFLKDNFPDKDIHFVGDSHPTFTGKLFPEAERLSEEYFKEPFLAIVCDVGEKKRIADPRYEMADTILKFDHHPVEKDIAKYSILEDEAGSCAEIVSSFCLSWKGKKLSMEAARYFFIGIVGDTGRFMYASAGSHSIEMASRLVSTGFSTHDTYLAMYEKGINDLSVKAYLYSNFHLTEHGVAYYILPSSIQEQLHITSIQGKEGVNIFSNIEGINAWCSITEDPDPRDYCWRISIRSKKEDISKVANNFGGGGHKNASGARIASLEELPSLIEALDSLFK